MRMMFEGCCNFDGDISWWNTQNVEDLSNIFRGCSKFCCNVSNWNLAKLTEIPVAVFEDCDNMKDEYKFEIPN